MDKSYRTAIRRTKLSAPAKRLFEDRLLVGKCLDYGCGKGYDCDTLMIDGWDIYYRPEIKGNNYDTVMCNYVLNVIPSSLGRKRVLDRIISVLRPGGIAYITVRNDRSNLNGWTKNGTWQGWIKLPYPVIYKTSTYITYRIIKSFAD